MPRDRCEYYFQIFFFFEPENVFVIHVYVLYAPKHMFAPKEGSLLNATSCKAGRTHPKAGIVFRWDFESCCFVA